MNNTQDLQVSDDPALLDLMLADTRRAPALYKPTNYWAILERSLLKELRKIGLHDFRRRQNSVLCRFGATDQVPRPVQVNLPKYGGPTIGFPSASHSGRPSFRRPVI